MMPDLPNVGWERDIEAFREFFESPAFRADGLKLYPTLVIRGKRRGKVCIVEQCGNRSRNSSSILSTPYFSR